MLSFFFQAEDGIRDLTVTGVQTCALPISNRVRGLSVCMRELYRMETNEMKNRRVAFQGEPGAFSGEAARKLLGHEVELIPRSEERRVGKRVEIDGHRSTDNEASTKESLNM